eukprot:638872-Pelagomonas_calceolata.AAC.6
MKGVIVCELTLKPYFRLSLEYHALSQRGKRSSPEGPCLAILEGSVTGKFSEPPWPRPSQKGKKGEENVFLHCRASSEGNKTHWFKKAVSPLHHKAMEQTGLVGIWRVT